MTGPPRRRDSFGPLGWHAQFSDDYSEDYWDRTLAAAAAADRTDPPECTPEEVDFELEWQRGRRGSLRRELVAVNISERSWRLTGSPLFQLIGMNGTPVRSRHPSFLRLPIPNYVVVAPQQRARSHVTWSSQDRCLDSRSVIIRWSGGANQIETSGLTHPDPEPTPLHHRSHRGILMTTTSGHFEVLH